MFSPSSRAVREEMLQNILGLQTPEMTTGNTPIFDPDTLEDDDRAIFDELNDFEKYLVNYISSPFNPALLRFVGSPQEVSPSNPLSILSILSQTDPETRHTLHRLHGLQSLTLELEAIMCSNPSLVAQRDDLITIANLEIKQMLAALWSERGLRANNPLSMLGVRSIAIENHSVNLHVSPLVMSALVLTAIIHTVMGVSRKNCNFVLACIRAIVSMALKIEMHRSEEFIRQHVADIPSTLPTTLHRLNLCPKFDLYACCPGCKKLYPCSNIKDQLLPTLCGAKDLDGKSPAKTIETYSHMRFETWVSELVMREGVENLLESARPNYKPGATMKDV
ncbi:hypothetical protein FRC12_013404 [Ceratobasidium sp. 428]|nr:hypothetical protein FRC12_013404 [Ceratobasidium sp. 428]